jgi:signal transduction histidine kinase
MQPEDATSRPQSRGSAVHAAETAGRSQDARDADFVASMAHDVNNMLTVVMGSIDQVGLQLPPTHPAFPDLSVARDAARRAAGMTKRLMLPGGQPALSAIDVNATIHNALRGLSRTLGERIALTHELAADLWPAHTDAEELWQMLFNLATNARDAMPDGGTLRIRTRNTTLTAHCTMATRTVVAGDYVAIEVTDTGNGMSPSVRPPAAAWACRRSRASRTTRAAACACAASPGAARRSRCCCRGRRADAGAASAALAHRCENCVIRP